MASKEMQECVLCCVLEEKLKRKKQNHTMSVIIVFFIKQASETTVGKKVKLGITCKIFYFTW